MGTLVTGHWARTCLGALVVSEGALVSPRLREGRDFIVPDLRGEGTRTTVSQVFVYHIMQDRRDRRALTGSI